MNSFTLNNGRDAEAGAVHEIVLSSLYVCSEPIPADGVADIEHASFGFHIHNKTSVIEGTRGGVEPVTDVAWFRSVLRVELICVVVNTLHQLGRLLTKSHARKKVLDTNLYWLRRIFVEGTD